MSEQEQMSQLSALFDNELPPAQSELVIRRALKDPALRASWERYALIGACLRNEPIHSDKRLPDVADRVRTMLAAEAEHPAQSAPAFANAPGTRRGMSMVGRGALGGAIAAGVAVVSLFTWRSMDAPVGAPAMQIAQAGVPAAGDAQPVAVVAQVESRPVVAVADSPPPSYTTPIDSSPTQRISGQLVNLVVAHSQYAAESMPIIPMSTLMNGNYDVAQGAVEMTEAQIGAYR